MFKIINKFISIFKYKYILYEYDILYFNIYNMFSSDIYI